MARSQIFPFYYYANEIQHRFGVHLEQWEWNQFLRQGTRTLGKYDIVIVQPWFTLGNAAISRAIELVRERCAPGRIIFLDGYAPTDLRFAEVLSGEVDVYVKKHLLRDRSQYGVPTHGDTNITHFCASHYGVALPVVTFTVPQDILEKLVVGPSFVTADYMYTEFRATQRIATAIQFDVHARFAVQGADWYQSMREDAMHRVLAIPDIRIAAGPGVKFAQYMRELSSSLLCFSPFGYGEVAWRDFEAILCGSVLVKPDMSHIEMNPNIFVPGETYVPIRWDFEDLEEKVRYYLANSDERERIRGQAFELLHAYVQEARFLEHVASILG